MLKFVIVLTENVCTTWATRKDELNRAALKIASRYFIDKKYIKSKFSIDICH